MGHYDDADLEFGVWAYAEEADNYQMSAIEIAIDVAYETQQPWI